MRLLPLWVAMGRGTLSLRVSNDHTMGVLYALLRIQMTPTHLTNTATEDLGQAWINFS